MVQLIIPGSAQVVIRAECSGQEVINVLGFGIGGSTAMGDLANAVKTAWEAANGPLANRPTQLKMIDYKATNLAEGGAVATVVSNKAGGTSATNLATMASSALIVYGNGTRDRSGRGRMYHGPLGETQVDADGRTLATVTSTVLTTCYTKFRDDMSAAGFGWQVLSRKDSAGRLISAVSVASIIATQRRRLR